MTREELDKMADAEVEAAGRVLEIAHAAHRLRVCHETIRRWIRAGKLAAIKTPGGHWRIGEASVNALCATNRNNHQHPPA